MSLDPLSDEAFAQAIDMMGNHQAARGAIHVEFYTEEIPDEAATEAEGRPMFKTVEMCRKRVPGDRDNVVEERIKYMKPDPRKEYPVEYARFQAGEKIQAQGQLLRRWGLLDPSTVKGYESLGIITVENLAAVSDANASQVRGLLADRQKAQDFLAMAKGLQPASEARAEAEKLRAQMRALQEQIDDLKAAKPKGKGKE